MILGAKGGSSEPPELPPGSAPGLKLMGAAQIIAFCLIECLNPINYHISTYP